MKPVFIIAEAGVNHNGSIQTALKMIDAAKECGVDAIKFQTFNPTSLVCRFAQKAEYQKKKTGGSESQLQMLQKLALSLNEHCQLFNYCNKINIKYLSSPFDFESIDFLNQLGLEIFKIPSGEITNLPYLQKIAKLNKKILLSTGMAYLDEVKNAIKVFTNNGTKRKNITLLHCTTEYPAPIKDVNLKAMDTLRHKLGFEVGYSDHTTGIEISIAAAARGAAVIEKHFTLDKTMKGPDHRASLEPADFKLLVSCIRNIEKAMGNGIKRPAPSEIKNRGVARKSIVASCYIKKGEKFTEQNIAAKRPGTGISPMNWDRVLGKKASRNYIPDAMIAL